jgi:thioredoxin reductase
MSDADVVIVGDGPTGLSAALLLEKNGQDTIVLGEDETPMHQARLRNILGIEDEDGTPFMERAREQARSFGADLREARVTGAGETNGSFVAETEDGDTVTGDRLVLATGTDRSLAEDLDLAMDGDVIEADKEGFTSREGVLAGGWAIRPHKVQAANSIGDGASIALSILSAEAGEPVHDFDLAD